MSLETIFHGALGPRLGNAPGHRLSASPIRKSLIKKKSVTAFLAVYRGKKFIEW